MRLKIRADSVRECRRQWLRNERGRPLSSDLGLLQCFFGRVAAEPPIPRPSPRRPYPSDLPDFCSANRVWPPLAGRFPPSAFARRRPLQIVHLDHANFINIPGLHSQFKYSTEDRVSYLTTESQFNCKTKHLKTLNPASHV